MDISNSLPEIKIYRSPWKGLRLMLLCSPFVGFSVFDLMAKVHDCSLWFDWVCLCFFGVGIIYGLFIIFDRRPQIIINETGILDRGAGLDLINWNIIDHAYWKTINNLPFVCIIIKDDYKQLIKYNNKFYNLAPKMGLTDINISLGHITSIQKEQLGAFIIAMKDAKPIDRSRMLKQHFEKLA